MGFLILDFRISRFIHLVVLNVYSLLPVRPWCSETYNLEQEQLALSCAQLLLKREGREGCWTLHVQFLLLSLPIMLSHSSSSSWGGERSGVFNYWSSLHVEENIRDREERFLFTCVILLWEFSTQMLHSYWSSVLVLNYVQDWVKEKFYFTFHELIKPLL